MNLQVIYHLMLRPKLAKRSQQGTSREFCLALLPLTSCFVSGSSAQQAISLDSTLSEQLIGDAINESSVGSSLIPSTSTSKTCQSEAAQDIEEESNEEVLNSGICVQIWHNYSGLRVIVMNQVLSSYVVLLHSFLLPCKAAF